MKGKTIRSYMNLSYAELSNLDDVEIVRVYKASRKAIERATEKKDDERLEIYTRLNNQLRSIIDKRNIKLDERPDKKPRDNKGSYTTSIRKYVRYSTEQLKELPTKTLIELYNKGKLAYNRAKNYNNQDATTEYENFTRKIKTILKNRGIEIKTRKPKELEPSRDFVVQKTIRNTLSEILSKTLKATVTVPELRKEVSKKGIKSDEFDKGLKLLFRKNIIGLDISDQKKEGSIKINGREYQYVSLID